MLLAEELLLLTDNNRRCLLVAPSRGPIVGAALCLELHHLGRLRLTGPREYVGEGFVAVDDPSPTGDDILDWALAKIRAARKPEGLIEHLGTYADDRLLFRLESMQLMRREQRKRLGLFPYSRWELVSSAYGDARRLDLQDVLVGSRLPTVREGDLISLLDASWALARVKPPGSNRRYLARRVKEIVGTPDFVTEALRDSTRRGLIAGDYT